VAANFKDRDGATPVAWAIRADNLEAVKILLEIRQNGRKVVDPLQIITRPSQNSLLHEAAKFGREDIIDHLLSTNAFQGRLELANETGQTVLHIASQRAGPAAVDRLHKAGGDLNAKTTNPRTQSQTCLDIAVTDGKRSTVELLKELNVTMSSALFYSRMKARASAGTGTSTGAETQSKASVHASSESYDSTMTTFEAEQAAADVPEA